MESESWDTGQVRHRLRQHIPVALQGAVRDDQPFNERGGGRRRDNGPV